MLISLWIIVPLIIIATVLGAVVASWLLTRAIWYAAMRGLGW